MIRRPLFSLQENSHLLAAKNGHKVKKTAKKLKKKLQI
jgi:hypothetical protein